MARRHSANGGRLHLSGRIRQGSQTGGKSGADIAIPAIPPGARSHACRSSGQSQQTDAVYRLRSSQRTALELDTATLNKRVQDLVENGVTGWTFPGPDGKPQPVTLPEGTLANTAAELTSDPAFGNQVLGQGETFQTIRDFVRTAKQQGY